MRNRPFNPFMTSSANVWQEIAARPDVRIVILMTLLCLPIPLIALRVTFVQSVLPSRILPLWELAITTTQPIPARDGRIVSQDGVVLAFDQPRYNLSLHYRWLEEPPNSAWVRRTALATLPRQQRRDREQVARAVQDVLDQRDMLWKNLEHASGVSLAELRLQAAAIQNRVERMRKAVEARRSRQQDSRKIAPLDFSQGLSGIWETLHAELMTPPDRFAHDPLILKEELLAHALLEDVPIEVVGMVQSYPSRFPGIEVVQTTERVYPEDRLAVHVLGSRRFLPDSAAVQRVGLSGIEASYQSVLGGTPGSRHTVRDRRDNVLSVHVSPPPIDGRDAVLNLDSRLQRMAEDLLDRVLGGEFLPVDDDLIRVELPAIPTGGAIVIMDVWTGDLLVAAAGPAPAQHELVQPTRAEWDKLLADPRAPLFNRLTRMSLAPGSVATLLTAMTALESGMITSDDIMFCQGFLDSPDRHRCSVFDQNGAGHGDIALTGALSEDCVVYFLAVGRSIPADSWIDWAQRFGLGRKTGVDLTAEATGHVPSRNTPQAADLSSNTPEFAMQLAIGQSSVTVTPLQVTRMMAAIANGGFLVRPQLMSESDAEVATRSPALEASPDGTGSTDVVRVTGLTATMLAVVRDGLIKAVQDDRGTARAVRVEGIPVAGTAATVQVAGERADHAWFSGYIPADQPRYVVTVALEHGGSGSAAAAPLARELIQAMAVLGLLTPDFNELSDVTGENPSP